MELGKTTETDVKEMYNLEPEGVNKYSKGNQYFIDPTQLDLEDLKSTLIIFDEKGVLVFVGSEFNSISSIEDSKNRYKKFDYLYKILASKYKLVKKERPFVGDQYAKFKDGNSEIELSEPHMGGFKINLTYAKKEFLDAFQKIQSEDKKQKTKDEASSL
ncbi:TPA: hypothetical protein PXF07_001739 [Mannheimia haemolytica]|uniref:Uncharacterized protein n=5 Tax=Mannheimia haemolytica TaxID=75985 RepID=A0A547EDX1_MANHA|nr:hypothetical protein [Mannheimia haemolytica]AWW71266.1 hypothetical protein C4O86_05450 [Pasteurellaceae bacterium 12565]AGI32398.1 hypothetical protein D650_11290 [Mannheimia haemolytica USDA-ARS-USMARC-183]AGI35309.1 hypothetical protein D648_13050 [Mannheimia haemolytica USDA-ARS-USMARC-185]AGK02482.1 hypothetical protein MHH_c20360 [Mannheimia haemolytica M42548]AGQ24724.1 hypothetical protein F382_01365 [Mannheimia haemolytica D153]